MLLFLFFYFIKSAMADHQKLRESIYMKKMCLFFTILLFSHTTYVEQQPYEVETLLTSDTCPAAESARDALVSFFVFVIDQNIECDESLQNVHALLLRDESMDDTVLSDALNSALILLEQKTADDWQADRLAQQLKTEYELLQKEPHRAAVASLRVLDSLVVQNHLTTYGPVSINSQDNRPGLVVNGGATIDDLSVGSSNIGTLTLGNIYGVSPAGPLDFVVVNPDGQLGSLPGGGTGGISAIMGNSGSLVTGSIVTISGNGNNITTSGSGSTLTVSVSGTTLNAVQVGNASGSLTSITPGTTGYILTSQGASALPIWLSPTVGGTVNSVTGGTGITITGTPTMNPVVNLTVPVAVANGGTGDISFTPYAPVVGGTSPTSALQSASTGQLNPGYVLTSTGSTSLPTWQPVSSSGAVTSVNAGNNISITGTQTAPVVNVAGTTTNAVQIGNSSGSLTSLALGTNGQVLLGATGAAPAFAALTSTGDTLTFTPGVNSLNIDVTQPLSVSYGGTGLTSIPQYSLVAGNGTSAVATIAPSSTSGIPLISNGVAAQPSFGTAVVAGGGTGETSFTSYAPIVGGTTGTGALQSASAGQSNVNYVFTSTGSSSVPTWQPVSSSGAVTTVVGGTGINITGTTNSPVVNLTSPVSVIHGGTGLSSLTAHNLLVGEGTAQVALIAPGTAGQVLMSNGANVDPSFGTATVPGGGTGETSFTAHSILLGEGTSNIASTGPGNAGQILVAAGPSADPAFVTPTVGTGLSLSSNSTTLQYSLSIPVAIASGGTNATSMSNTDGVVYFDGTKLNTTNVGLADYVLTSNGAGNAPSFQPVSTIGVVTMVNAGNNISITGTAISPVVNVANTTTNAVQVGSPNGALHSLPLGTNGQVLLGATGTAPAFAALTSTGGTLTFTPGTNSLSIDVTAPLSVSYGGTGLTSIPQYSLVAGNGTSAVATIAPSSTSGIPLISNGVAAQPSFGTAVVAGGGTGETSFTSYAPIVGGTTGTGALQSASTGQSNVNYVFTSTGSSSVPTWQPVSASGAVTTVVGGTGINITGTTNSPVVNLTSPVSVIHGGTGLSSLTAHNLLVGEGTAQVALIAPGTAGQVLMSNGANVDPSFGVATVPGGGTGELVVPVIFIPRATDNRGYCTTCANRLPCWYRR